MIYVKNQNKKAQKNKKNIKKEKIILKYKK